MYIHCFLYSQEESAWSISFDSIAIRSYRDKSFVKTKTDGTILWDMNSLGMLPQILGNADPIHYAQMLPGVQTNSEYRSGINIEGCDNQHNMIRIEGVPIYNVNHLLGFFSTFNTPHFPSMSISKGMVSAASPNRLGGQLEMLHHTEIPDSASGIVSLGLIASQGTIRVPISSNTAISASFRGSYINMLYSRWLEVDGQQIKYSFYDANVSLVHRMNSQNTFLFDYYSGSDNGGFSDDHYLASMKARWGNNMGAIHWIFNNGKLCSRSTAYYTSYRNRFSLDMQDMSFRLPSSITDLGFKNDLSWKRRSAGFETIWHDIHPQSLEHQGNFNMTDGYTPPTHSFETSFYGNCEYPFGDYLSVLGGLRGSLYIKGETVYGAVDPSLRLLYHNHTSQLSITYALRHQYLFQTGFSDLGLPTEFWISGGEDFCPQYAHEFSFSGSRFILNRKYRCSVDLFYRKLYHQLSYKGSILDYVNSIYDLKSSLMYGKGENYGFSIMLNKCVGNLTGWISYTYTHARRSFDETTRRKSYPASHERPHELNAVAAYNIDKHWNVGGTIVYASGTPFTAAKSVLLLNNNLIIQYGEYNAARLHPYMRVDLSANYKWNNPYHKEHGINFSLYNVLCRDNELFYYLRTRSDGSFVYRPVTFVLHLLPSISYYYKF